MSINAAISHLKNMPLDKLSNKPSDCFILDKKRGTFTLKDIYKPYWEKDFFREMVKDRVEFALKRYFKDCKN
ncbi:hypothetical protein MTBBW1_280010 [Desulfamplus magnetovallimortis]|uniref:Uncharacterized protein n=1 Tax=Desulfamplus magnetovallimortis TaxID=1246637 RepID=A0A1W1HF99_9BACT|nr:hypothetical protein MTBBW1_280010 [Desulfamplus magnetovallimortis]